MTRRRLLRALTLLIVLGVLLRVTGIVKIPDRILFAAIALDIALGLVETAVIVFVGRRIYRSYRERLDPFDAFIETLREIEPVPPKLFALEERELRYYHRVYRRLRRRA